MTSPTSINKSTLIDVPLCQFGAHRSYENEDIIFYINYCFSTSEKGEFKASVCHIERFLKSKV